MHGTLSKLTEEQRAQLLTGEEVELYKPPPDHCAVVKIINNQIVFSSTPSNRAADREQAEKELAGGV